MRRGLPRLGALGLEVTETFSRGGDPVNPADVGVSMEYALDGVGPRAVMLVSGAKAEIGGERGGGGGEAASILFCARRGQYFA